MFFYNVWLIKEKKNNIDKTMKGSASKILNDSNRKIRNLNKIFTHLAGTENAIDKKYWIKTDSFWKQW